jgi:hypothetical protein
MKIIAQSLTTIIIIYELLSRYFKYAFFIYNISFFIYDLICLLISIRQKENMKTKTLLIIALVMAMISISFIGCTPEPVSIESIVLSKDIGPDSAPIDPAIEFESGTSIIYISIKVNNMTPEDKLSVEWNYLESGDEINTSGFTTEETGSGYIGFNIKVAQGFPTGKYNVLVYLNDEHYETLEFSVN